MTGVFFAPGVCKPHDLCTTAKPESVFCSACATVTLTGEQCTEQAPGRGAATLETVNETEAHHAATWEKPRASEYEASRRPSTIAVTGAHGGQILNARHPVSSGETDGTLNPIVLAECVDRGESSADSRERPATGPNGFDAEQWAEPTVLAELGCHEEQATPNCERQRGSRLRPHGLVGVGEQGARVAHRRHHTSLAARDCRRDAETKAVVEAPTPWRQRPSVAENPTTHASEVLILSCADPGSIPGGSTRSGRHEKSTRLGAGDCADETCDVSTVPRDVEDLMIADVTPGPSASGADLLTAGETAPERRLVTRRDSRERPATFSSHQARQRTGVAVDGQGATWPRVVAPSGHPLSASEVFAIAIVLGGAVVSIAYFVAHVMWVGGAL